MQRHLMLAGLLGTAVGVPYVINKGAEGFPDLSNWSTTESAAQAEQSAELTPLDLPDVDRVGPDSDIYNQPAPLAGPRVHSLAEVLRMDVTKEWVYQRWARKSTGLADPEFFGVRVPLVTGTGMGDLAGSLTYYFDAQRKLTHITFYGTTGNSLRLANLLQQRYGFRPREVEGTSGQLLVVSKFDQTLSWCQIEPVDVIDSQRIHSRYRVSLNMIRPPTLR